MLVLVIWILLLVFIDVDSIQTVSIILIRFDVFSPFFFPSAHWNSHPLIQTFHPQRQASDGGKGKMSLETKIEDGVPCG